MSPESKGEEELMLEANLEKAKRNSESNAHKKINLSELNAKLEEELSVLDRKEPCRTKMNRLREKKGRISRKKGQTITISSRLFSK